MTISSSYGVEDYNKFSNSIRPDLQRIYKEGVITKGTGNEAISYVNVIQRVSGIHGYMCPRCYKIHYRYICAESQYSTEQRAVITDPEYEKEELVGDSFFFNYECEECKEEHRNIELDPNIAEAISILNKKGYITKYCCEGHPYSLNSSSPDGAYIFFANEVQMSKMIEDIPFGWYIDYASLKANRDFIIRAEYNPSLDYIYELTEWAKSLPQADKRDVSNTVRSQFLDMFYHDLNKVYGIWDEIREDDVKNLLERSPLFTELGYTILGI